MKQRVILTASAAVILCLGAAGANAQSAGKSIALSNNYAGNSWRQAMIESWEETTSKAVEEGVVGSADAFTTAENSATEQAAQLQNMILQGYDAIVLNSASPTALNGAVKEACDAGITVVSFDGVVTEPCAWRIAVDFKKMGTDQIDYLAKRYPDGGKLLEIRGLPGTSVDEEIHAGIVEGVKNHPNFEVVREVQGDWTQTVAQKSVASVLPSLPDVVGVVTQGGDGYGAAEAFKAAGREVPTIIMGNRSDELGWWKEQKDANGYETFSQSIAPGVSTLAFWVAQAILDGKDVPKDLVVPTLRIDQDGLAEGIEMTPDGGVTNQEYTREQAAELVSSAK
ncbi:ABC transporter substrate-binding protein [Fulvimarina sp. 2208YS6-2-32]|uniref:ABC transporter substrate-binding protein n=1 Tax=Fulvimarina uroteuthidis TaxID=3098149 RepID=A0ABU5HZH9_9HYPH|nr:ABC transporter substrate-binding protein [Fulvimarina sp. 2208YS6-2-32]MDY8107963.1 ABC transporter substrate-binding protein [Fulvimarina sp. 2208YS6-2-32]